jgi:hypothetical protein
MYRVDYNTGISNHDEFDNLEDAMKYADNNACYTQQNIQIYDECDDMCAERIWIGILLDDDNGAIDNPLAFGESGYYTDWIIY